MFSRARSRFVPGWGCQSECTGNKRFLGVPKERFVLCGAELGGGKRENPLFCPKMLKVESPLIRPELSNPNVNCCIAAFFDE